MMLELEGWLVERLANHSWVEGKVETDYFCLKSSSKLQHGNERDRELVRGCFVVFRNWAADTEHQK